MRMALLLAGLIAVEAGAQAPAQHRVPHAATHSLSPAAAEVVARFDAATADARTSFAALSTTSGVAENLASRVEIDQALRRALPDLSQSALTHEDREAANVAVWQRIAAVDAANTAYLKTVLPADGWFRNGRDGEQVAHNAWLIVQHSPDQAFQRDVVARMAPLVTPGEVNGRDYALLYDRTELFAGRPQRFGSQVECRNGRWAPATLEDPESVDARRASVGLTPMAEYLKKFEGGC